MTLTRDEIAARITTLLPGLRADLDDFMADYVGHPLRDIHGTTLLIGLRATNPYFTNFTEAPVASGGLVQRFKDGGSVTDDISSYSQTFDNPDQSKTTESGIVKKFEEDYFSDSEDINTSNNFEAKDFNFLSYSSANPINLLKFSGVGSNLRWFSRILFPSMVFQYSFKFNNRYSLRM